MKALFGFLILATSPVSMANQESYTITFNDTNIPTISYFVEVEESVSKKPIVIRPVFTDKFDNEYNAQKNCLGTYRLSKEVLKYTFSGYDSVFGSCSNISFRLKSLNGGNSILKEIKGLREGKSLNIQAQAYIIDSENYYKAIITREE